MAWKQRTSCNCAELEQMLKLFCCFSFSCLFLFFDPLSHFLFSLLLPALKGTVFFSPPGLLNWRALGWVVIPLWITQSICFTPALARNSVSHRKIGRLELVNSNYLYTLCLFSYLVSSYCNKLRKNWEHLHFQALLHTKITTWLCFFLNLLNPRSLAEYQRLLNITLVTPFFSNEMQ